MDYFEDNYAGDPFGPEVEWDEPEIVDASVFISYRLGQLEKIGFVDSEGGSITQKGIEIYNALPSDYSPNPRLAAIILSGLLGIEEDDPVMPLFVDAMCDNNVFIDIMTGNLETEDSE